ncbi:hypothetical protein AMECASPLE_029229 [Ameca splendens]|uniref:Uncharacterized protein n=1 Tax=Ameca splendens TaxID=208324 RepID=A0ABV1AD29_9TELE
MCDFLLVISSPLQPQSRLFPVFICTDCTDGNTRGQKILVLIFSCQSFSLTFKWPKYNQGPTHPPPKCDTSLTADHSWQDVTGLTLDCEISSTETKVELL